MLQVRNVRIGEGKPKICVPIRTINEAEYIAYELGNSVDLAEFRIDYLKEVHDEEQLSSVLDKVHQKLGDIPLLCIIGTTYLSLHTFLLISNIIYSMYASTDVLANNSLVYKFV